MRAVSRTAAMGIQASSSAASPGRCEFPLEHVKKYLPPGHLKPFHGDYSVLFAGPVSLSTYCLTTGGTSSLAQRFLAASTEKDARKSALLSATLYLVWPPILFFRMWAAPQILPHLADPSKS
jgi:solute:Na+ symporter, SSS family